MPTTHYKSRSEKTPQKKHQQPKAGKVKKKPKSKGWLWFKRISLSLLGILLVAGIGAGVVAATYIASAPTVSQEDLIGTLPSNIYDKDDNVIYKLGGNDRILIDPSAIPKNVENAIISIEDRRFYEHNGVDLIRIGGSLLSNLKTGGLQGGSTITQQLVKLSVFSTDSKDQTIKRKIQEIWLAMGLEREYTKKDILALYLNKVFLANNTYGFGTAAKYYFNKDASELSIAEAALFAGMVQAPSAYDPVRHPEEATQRRNVVLKAMLDNGKITEAEYNTAVNTSVTENLVDHSNDKSSDELAVDAFIQVVLDEVSKKTKLDPYTQGLDIYTTLDMNAQNKLNDITNTEDYIKWGDDELQAAVSVINPNDGSIVAMSGGRNTKVLLGVNRATSATRSVGSTSKPLIDYGPAIEYLNYSTGTIISDSPINYTNGPELHNYDNQYYGNMTMRNALVQSRNTPALRTFQAVGMDNARAFLAKVGIVKDSLVESNAIGFEASPLQMSLAYGAFANGGTYYEGYTIRKITSRDGQSTTFTNKGTKAMSDYTAFMITNMLEGVPGNTADQAGISGLYQAGKTGSTNYTEAEEAQVTGRSNNTAFITPDGWFVGYTKEYVIASWVGYDQPYQLKHYLTAAEYRYAQIIYRNLMSYLMTDKPNTDWTAPSSVVKRGSEYYVKGASNVPAETTTTTRRSTSNASSANSNQQPDETSSSRNSRSSSESSSSSSRAQTSRSSQTTESTSRRTDE